MEMCDLEKLTRKAILEHRDVIKFDIYNKQKFYVLNEEEIIKSFKDILKIYEESEKENVYYNVATETLYISIIPSKINGNSEKLNNLYEKYKLWEYRYKNFRLSTDTPCSAIIRISLEDVKELLL